MGDLTYILLLGGSISIPLLRSFEPRLRFASRWRAIVPAILLSAVPFLIWDVLFTVLGVWGFNPSKYLDVHLIGLPLEEVLFFLVIPYCCLFIHAVIDRFLTVDRVLSVRSLRWLIVPSVAALVVGLWNAERLYTSTVLVLTAAVLFFAWMNRAVWFRTFLLAYLVSLVPFILVNGALTGSFGADEVVWYDDLHNLGIRVLNIPVEDFFYSFVLLALNTALYERFMRSRPAATPAVGA